MIQLAVIVVTYNGSKWIQRCLQSIVDSRIPTKIIVVDNNSTDDTCNIILKHFNQVLLFRLNKNLGFGKANNIGIKQALKEKVDYIFLLNQDAWVQPNTLQGLIEISNKNQDYYILSPIHLNGNGEQLDYYFSIYAAPEYCRNFYSDIIVKEYKLKEIYEIKFVNAAMWLIPSVCFTKIGGFDPIFFQYGEDSDFINRLHYHGFKAGVCPEYFGFHDRKQNIDNMEILPIKHRKARKKNFYLISFKNINQSFSQCLLNVLIYFSRVFLKSFLSFKTKIAIEELCVFLSSLKNLRLIIVHREISKKKSANFL